MSVRELCLLRFLAVSNGVQQARGEVHKGADGAHLEQEAGRAAVPQEGRRRPHRRRP